MSEAEFSNQQSRSGNTSRNSTRRVARFRQRRKKGVLFVCDLEVYQSDLMVLKSAGYLRSADPKAVSRAEFEKAIAGLLLRPGSASWDHPRNLRRATHDWRIICR